MSSLLSKHQSIVSLVALVIFVLTATDVAVAKKKKHRKRAVKTMSVQVIVEGAAVYKAPSFDASIVKYLRMGKKIKAAVKSYKGIDGFGSFFKVKIGDSKYGYISDVEVAKAGKNGGNSDQDSIDPLGSKDSKGMFSDPPKRADPIYFTRFIGISGGAVNYTEEIDKLILQSFAPTVGLKMSGPGVLFDGPPLDFNVAIGPQAPSHHLKFADGSSGFFMITDLLLMLPVTASDNFMLFLGAGPMVIYTKFEIDVPGVGVVDSQEVRAGLAAAGGLALRLGKSFAIRLEGKYFYEKVKYFGAGGALQMEY